MKFLPFYVELLCRRDDRNDSRPDRCQIYLPVGYVWQEDPLDLHFQLDTPEGREHYNIHPEQDKKSGDYVIPASPWLLKHLDFKPKVIKNYRWSKYCRGAAQRCDGVRVYHIAYRAQPEFREGGAIAPMAYRKWLECHWYSPN
jgi:hypothetical protein